LTKRCAVSVDLDEICQYERIHGLLASSQHNLVYSTAVARFANWAKAEALPITWFIVGEALDDEPTRERLKQRYAAGDELSNHSEHHRYDLTRLDQGTLAREVTACNRRLQDLTGETRFGFRAPGYVMTDKLAQVLRDNHALYDSSVFPCPPYYAAKAAVILGQRFIGRTSRSVLDHPRVLLAPTEPYAMGHHYWQRGNGLLELPITVSPFVRLPFIGTQLSLLGTRLANLLARSLASRDFLNLELHGIDALDDRDGLEGFSRVQPDLRIAWQNKLETYSRVVQTLKAAGFRFVTLRDAIK